MNFMRRQRGSITVLVTLILVPTIFFEGFLVDLARIKLCSNQAVMAADNYGDAVLSMYDNLLKELYGLFAVTQNKEGLDELETLEDYIKASFDPTESAISWDDLENTMEALGRDTSYEGFMPYKDADVELSYTTIDESTLSDTNILGTQIGDFMKFRIAQALFDSDDSDSTVDSFIEALDLVTGMESDSEAIDMENKVANQADEVLKIIRDDYYPVLKELYQYDAYIDNINDEYKTAKSEFDSIHSSSSYKIYYDYTKNKDAIKEAQEHEKRIHEAGEDTDDKLSHHEKELLKMKEDYDNDSEARADKLSKKFEEAIEKFEESETDSRYDIRFKTFDEKADKLWKVSQELAAQIETLKEYRDELQKILDSGDITAEMKTGIEEEIASLDDYFGEGGVYTSDNYVNLAKYLVSCKAQNDANSNQFDRIVEGLEAIKSACIGCENSIPKPPDSIDKYPDPIDDYKNFDEEDDKYKKLYKQMVSYCEAAEGDAKKADDKKNEASDLQDQVNKNLEDDAEKDSETSARDIPEEFNFGMEQSGLIDSSALEGIIGNLTTVATYFNSNNFSGSGTKLLIKAYTTIYDFGMFSSRVTNVDEDNDDVDKSLTGYEMASNINYLYQAELEYIFAGNNSSSDNLATVRNYIVTFRFMVNFISTYTIDEVNTAINEIREIVDGAFPGVGLAVSYALRLAIAGVESYEDWSQLKKGESVVLIKKDLDDLTAISQFASLLDNKVSGGTTSANKSSNSIKLNYNQYLMVLIIFMTSNEQAIERTGNLITLNVNTVQQKVGASGTLSKLEFELEKAYTAVEATCAVQLDFVVMPKGFAKQVLDDDTYSELESFEKNSYKYTVTRGY